MPFLQLRITLDPSGTRNRSSVFLLLKKFRRVWLTNQDDDFQSSAGYETLNKFGEPCDPHFHLNVQFVAPDLKDPLRSAKEWLRREANSLDFHLKGNKVWSCTLVDEPKDFDRWYRYPFKETPVPELCSLDFLSPLNQEQVTIAREERKRSIEINIIKREKAIDKQSFKDKLFKYLDDLFLGEGINELMETITHDKPLPDHQEIWVTILKYYTQQGKAVCFKTINGYATLYQLHIGQLTPEQCYVMRSNPQ